MWNMPFQNHLPSICWATPSPPQPSHPLRFSPSILWETFPPSLRPGFLSLHHRHLAHCLCQSQYWINACWKKKKWMNGLMDEFLPSLNWLSWTLESWALRVEVLSKHDSISRSMWDYDVHSVNQNHWKWTFASSKSFLHVSSELYCVQKRFYRERFS